ncbi:MAG: HEPN domain-containing protein [Muricauda sp.]|jgi:sulfite reductase (ferredoxin)|nr:HEPN domain-containing protein [Allomuricauda sp.]MBO6589541.1 HEPN domain-containing protein [Allomuricauda sp.]MBO6619027.1 HEPN domain-containing protein [Allomuricauda sp.]MBO6645077.1 HEPN domain-containing protein [Allomuricauda sp.]MBO6747148.1 HEPN domain-containing protein [Allomuricauda sp.]MBO6844832.1 HEPN domain-containing protein [Allomuricauda sp.]
MQSFRTEIENPVVEKDIIELEKKIRQFKGGEMDEEKFRSLRLARGVYGQRQPGVQMIRIKLPYGKVTSNQLLRIADVSDEYSRGRLHITTRQDIQIHYVDLERTPELWAQLEKDKVTLREACGNTVRNVTASETAGIDVDEPFDVSPYAQAVFEYFLRNPIGQEMGRKFKVSFSASDADTGLSYMHDLGFIAKEKEGERGFKVMLGGGLGSQPRHADELYSFLPTDKIIPLMEGVIRVFDRYGERKSRAKARMKFLLKDLGLDGFKKLLEEEQLAIPHHTYPIEIDSYPEVKVAEVETPKVVIEDKQAFEAWKSTNLVPQKQEGFVAIGIKVLLGDFYTDKARELAQLVQDYAAGEIRLSLRQNILIPYVKEELVPFFYQELQKLGFAEAGYNKALDITACPGTDTCNLGIASSTGIAAELERVIKAEYPQYIKNPDVVIKISGCMNACGQHNMAHIGFQGMSVRTKDKLVAPALQVLLGGGNFGDGRARFADKVAKIPSKRGPQALRLILDDFEANGNGASFTDYYEEKGQLYFYDFLKPLTDVDNLTQDDFIDWGNEEKYKKEIGIGECAGVIVDLVATLFLESQEKIDNAEEAIQEGKWAASIYYSYQSIVNSAKALLTAEKVKTNTHASIVKDFDELYVESGKIAFEGGFANIALQLNKNEPSEAFAKSYVQDAKEVLQRLEAFRKMELEHA